MEREGLWDESKEQKERSRIRKEVLAAFAKAEKERKPPLRSMFEDVYAELTEEQKEQMVQLRDILMRYPNEYDLDSFEGGLDTLRP